MRTLLSIAFLTLLFFAQLSFAEEVSDKVIPEKFRVIENYGMGGGKFMFEIDDSGFLNYYQHGNGFYSIDSNPGKPVFSKDLSYEEHRKILDTLDKINFWSWKKDYINTGVDDGLYWDISIKYGDKAVTAHGENGYPDKSGVLQENETEEYRQLIETLFSFTPYKNK